MKCKLAALLTAVLSLAMPVTAYCETAEAAHQSASYDALKESYSTETGMYIYTFEDGASFMSSEELGPDSVSTFVMWIGTDDDVEISMTLDGEPFEYAGDTVLDEAGSYAITLSHTLSDGEDITLLYNVTIQPLQSIEDTVLENTVIGRIQLQPASEGYSYAFASAGTVLSSVADGEISSAPVRLTVDEDISCIITRNGEGYSLAADGLITEDGLYNVTLNAAYDSDNVEIRYFSFGIYTEASSQLGIYHPPYGYTIDSVLLDDEEYPFEEGFCRFTRDGSYAVTYSNGRETKMTVLRRDTTPPVLYFNGGSELVFDSNVTVTADTPCTFSIQKNGSAWDGGTELRGNGIYRITATDAAGNTTSARVEITASSAVNPLLFVIVGLAAIAAAAAYIIVQKKKGPVVR